MKGIQKTVALSVLFVCLGVLPACAQYGPGNAPSPADMNRIGTSVSEFFEDCWDGICRGARWFIEQGRGSSTTGGAVAPAPSQNTQPQQNAQPQQNKPKQAKPKKDKAKPKAAPASRPASHPFVHGAGQIRGPVASVNSQDVGSSLTREIEQQQLQYMREQQEA